MKKSKYRLTCITLQSGKSAWYYVERGVKNPTKKATGIFGKRHRGEAEAFLKVLEEKESLTDNTFKQYAETYFTESCPHLLRLEGEGKRVGEKHVKKSRQILERVIFKDHLANMKIAEIKRRDVIEFRVRLLRTLRHDSQEDDKPGPPKYRTIRQVMETLKVVFRTAYYLEEIDRDPTAGIGKLKYEQKKRGVFKIEELKKLFPRDELGPWKNWTAHTLYLLACQSGMRLGELRALTWGQIDEKKKQIKVDRAFKGSTTTVGRPKGEKIRVTFLTERVLKAMDKLKAETLMELAKKNKGNSEYVFVNPSTDQPYSDPWWQDRFREALKVIGIDEKTRVARGLVGHSCRHTCNTILRDNGADDFKRKEALWGLSKSEIGDRYTNIEALDLSSLAEIMEKH